MERLLPAPRPDITGRALLTLVLAACRLNQLEFDEAANLVTTSLTMAADTLVDPIRTRAHEVADALTAAGAIAIAAPIAELLRSPPGAAS